MSKTIAFGCRVIVMLAFLIAIPLIALFGKSLPDALQTAWEYVRKPAQENRWPDADEAPLFKPDVSVSTATGTGNLAPPGSLLPPNSDPSVITAAHTADPTGSMTGSLGSSSLNPYTPPNGLGQNLAQNGGLAASGTGSAPIAVTPSGPYSSQPVSPMVYPPANSMGVPSSSDQQDNDAFRQINQRLQALGATYYRLELFGNGRPLYRFQCRLGIVGTGGLTRQFESSNVNPIEAMRQVLDKVEVWRQQSPLPTKPQQLPQFPPRSGQPSAGNVSFPNQPSHSSQPAQPARQPVQEFRGPQSQPPNFPSNPGLGNYQNPPNVNVSVPVPAVSHAPTVYR